MTTDMVKTLAAARAAARDGDHTAALCAEIERLDRLINNPQITNFMTAVHLEAAHQQERWGADHDARKTSADWFWLVGYLAGKALHAHVARNYDKARHHCITAAAAIGHWFDRITQEHMISNEHGQESNIQAP